jgi:NTE family protein
MTTVGPQSGRSVTTSALWRPTRGSAQPTSGRQAPDARPVTLVAITGVEIAARSAANSPHREREPKMAVCLSGGGFRAMLYHAGALRRLNELGLLSAVDRFSSVSGGSITAAVLARKWSDLRFDDAGVAAGFDDVERQLFDFAGRTIDVQSAIIGVLPGTTGAWQLARRYRRLLHEATLQDLPSEPPRFVFNTTNMTTGDLLRWSKAYGADYRLGRIDAPTVALCEVVAASSAFPPFLSPLRIRPPSPVVSFSTGTQIGEQPQRLWLTDGGVYDNLGIQTAESFHTVLASDGGAPLARSERMGHNWYSQHRRSVSVIYDQVCRLRERQFVGELKNEQRLGALWRISTNMADYPAADKLPCPLTATRSLADLPTRLAAMPVALRHRLINWGYASADAAVRSYVEPTLPAPAGFPCPGGVG